MANCTGIPNGSALEKRIKDCCLKHDYDYVTMAGTRAEADKAFHDCVEAKTDPITALILYMAVVAGGWFFWYRRKIKNMIKSNSNKRK